MHAKSEYAGIISKDLGCPIPLVNVKVDNKNPSNQSLLQEEVSSDGDIVKKAKSLAFVSEGMMSAACNVHCDTKLKGKQGTLQCAVYYANFPIDQLPGYWKPGTTRFLMCKGETF